MGCIQVLSDLVINKIAAGEVVERPASVVKELLDNALDAGAASITVTVSHGGKSKVRVTDDGCGMDESDAKSCLIRHATSKISSLEDIQGIATMGFRGEAMASIASVSRLTIITRTANADTSTIVQTSGGESPDLSQGVHAIGTTIVVEDLFYNTPARRCFLKSNVAEYGAIAEKFSTLALSRPDISFVLQKNDLVAADYPACASKRERIAQVLGGEFTENLHDLELNAGDFSVQGFIGSPDYTRVNRTGQKIFINSRPVVSPAINNALSRAYDEFLPARRFPVAVLFLDIPAENLDVNVHPAKREVRIRNERAFIQQLTGAVRAELRKRGFHVQVDTTDFIQPPSDFRASETRSVFSHEREGDKPWRVPSGLRPDSQSSPDLFTDGPVLHMSAAQALFETEEQELPFDMTRILGQLHACYLVVASKDGFFLVDQHAAHERVVYEDLLSSMQHEKAASQQLLFPAELQLGEQESVVLQQDLKLLEGMGFGLNDQGGGSFSILAVPGCLMDSDAAALLTDCVHELVERSQTSSFDSRQQELAAVLACKTYAVKAGRALETTEQLHLVRRLGACDNPHACPHGRPTFIRISGAEIEKRFLRT